MAPSQPTATSSPHPAHTAGPSTISSSSTSPTGTHSTVATTVGNGGNTQHRQRSWNEDKNLNLYILDYCRRRKFDETALIFEREAGIPSDSKVSFDAPQGLLFEWWIVFWETFNSQRSSLAGPPGQRESSQVYVNTMARLRKLAMHEKDEQHRARSMSMSMSTPGMPNPMMGGMGPAMNGSGPASAMSTPAMGNMPNPMGGPRPQSQASVRMGPQPGMGQPGQQHMGPGASGQPGMPPQQQQQQQQQGPNMGPGQINGPQQPGMIGPQPGMQQGQPRPQQPGMGMAPGIQMTPNMTHASTPHASTPSAPHTHVSSTPSPVPTPPQNFPGGGGGPGPQQQPPFNPQFSQSQPQFSAPGGPGQGPFPGQPGGPGQFPGGPGNNQQQFRPGPGQNGPPGQNAPFPPNAGPGFQPNAGGPGGQNFGPGQPGFQPGGPGGPVPQQPFPSGPGGPQFPSGPGMSAPGGPGGPGGFPPGMRQGPGLPFQNNGQPPEWAQRPPAMGPGGPEGRRPDGSWEDGRPRPGGMMGQQGKMGAPHPQMQRYLGQPGGPPMMGPQPGMGGPQPGMGSQPGMGGGPQQQMGGPAPSPKEDARSVTPQQTQQGWNQEGGIMQRRPGVAAQGGQMGPRPGFNQGPQPGGPGGMGGPGGQKRPGSPPPPVASTNPGGSPPEKRLRPNDPGPGVLVDSRGSDGRPTSSKGGAPFQGQGQGQGMNGQNPQTQQKINQYAHEIRGVTQEMRGNILRQGPQPPPFGKGPQQNGANPGRGSRPPDAPSPASGGEGPGQPRQVMNVKGQASNSMGPPVSPSLTHRNVAGVKKSESAGSSPALPPSTIPNGMNPNDRSQTPQQMKQGGSQSPMPAPMTRPQSAQPTMNQGPSIGIPPPPGSAPPILPPTQSPSNGMIPFNTKFDQHFDFGPEMDFTNLTNEFFPDMDPMLGLGDWPDNE